MGGAGISVAQALRNRMQHDEATIESDAPVMMSPRDTLRDMAPLSVPAPMPTPAPAFELAPEPRVSAEPPALGALAQDVPDDVPDDTAELTPEEEDRLTAAVDAALEDELDDL
jgi:hypothetical protein